MALQTWAQCLSRAGKAGVSGCAAATASDINTSTLMCFGKAFTADVVLLSLFFAH